MSRLLDLPQPERAASRERWHGTANGYINHLCRCKHCTVANREKTRVYRESQRALREAEQNAGDPR